MYSKHIKTQIRAIRFTWLAIIIYFIAYNTFFGWNQQPESPTEKLLDDVLVIAFYIALGMCLRLVLDHIKYTWKLLEKIEKNGNI
jgi:hypothetical protein